MKANWRALAWGALLFLVGGSAEAGSLAGDRDTVMGVEYSEWKPPREWDRVNFIRLHNLGNSLLPLDSIRLPADSFAYRGNQTYAERLDCFFAVRTYAGGARVWQAFGRPLKSANLALAPGDSADIGIFEVGKILILVKQSAAPKHYLPGDTLVAPVTVFAGADSVRFILKAKVMLASSGSAIAPVRFDRMAGGSRGTRRVSADGRAVRSGAVETKKIFRKPAAGSGYRRR